VANNIVVLKFVEVAFRALFIIAVTYSLDTYQAGQFGLFVTLQGLTSFAFGYERYIDIQRRFVGESPSAFDRAVCKALCLFFVNYILISPIYLSGLIIAVKIYDSMLILCLLIAISEQLMNQSYLMSIVEKRYSQFLYLASAKNVLLLGLLVTLFILDSLSLNNVLIVWAIVASAAMVFIGVSWLRMSECVVIEWKTIGRSLLEQYTLSKTHFLLGLAAILTLQLDRFVVGALLPLESVGIYFRHILVVSVVYQVFNIASYNRVLPKIFRLGKTQSLTTMRDEVAKEYLRLLLFLVVAVVGVAGAYLINDGAIFKRFELNPVFVICLLITAGARVRADLNSLIFNALLKENIILKMQLVTLCVLVLLSVLFTFKFGISGTILASFAGAYGYMLYTFRSLKKVKAMPDSALPS
jgi:O-antigen/teichoic acid export membrane protein